METWGERRITAYALEMGDEEEKKVKAVKNVVNGTLKGINKGRRDRIKRQTGREMSKYHIIVPFKQLKQPE